MPELPVRRSARKRMNRSVSGKRPTRSARRVKPSGPRERGRSQQLRARLLFAALALALVVGGWYLSQDRSASLDRTVVIERAESWTDQGVPYSQTKHRDGYRMDCSGFVSMAWDLPENLTTWRIPLVAEEIAKDDLKPGDVLLDYKSEDRHVVIFEKWANDERTAYWGLESSGHPDIEGAVRRMLPYPYLINTKYYRPYRYVGMDAYWDKVPGSDRQPVQGYDGKEVRNGS